MSKDKPLKAQFDDWLYWCRTRAFYGPPQPKHILALLSMPDTSREPPSAKLSAEMAAFNLSVIALPDHIGRPVIQFYFDWPANSVKQFVYDEKIGLRTYYDRVHVGEKLIMRGVRCNMALIENLKILHRADFSARNSSARFDSVMVDY